MILGPEILQYTHVIGFLFFIYGLFICGGYAVTSIYSLLELRDYKRNTDLMDETALLKSTNLPSVSILAPAYNEELNVIDNVNSLLTLNYPKFEIVIINDGSGDNTLERLVEKYNLVRDDWRYYQHLKTETVRGIYKSTNPAYKNLKVIDKANGGKADALNAGINISAHEIICCIDVDCILDRDSLLKLIKPFLNNAKKVIASGGIIRVANSCKVEDGRIVEVDLPNTFLAKAQILEYFRAFLMGRMAWSRIDGLLLISGAFGMCDKQTVIDAGGYRTDTVGEDMELLVRMRRMMREREMEYKVGFVPDPLCWTEVPQDWKVLHRQRNRWTRGTIETLLNHKKMLFNPKYKILGMLSTPYWFFFEWLAPLVEFLGIIYFVLLLSLGKIEWTAFMIFAGLAYTYALFFSIMAIYFEEFSFQQYKKPSHILKLILTAMLEPIFYHPFVMWASVKGNIDFLRGKTSWGQMDRVGLNTKQIKEEFAKVN